MTTSSEKKEFTFKACGYCQAKDVTWEHLQGCKQEFLKDKQPGPEFDALILRMVGWPIDSGWTPTTRDDHALVLLRHLMGTPMGWQFSIQLSEEHADIYATAGDCNCPHRKEYDPSDTHGYSSVESEMETETFAHAACLVAYRCFRIKPGEPFKEETA